MIVELFDVEHGGCTLISSDSGARMLIDCGHNATTGWRPSTYLPRRGITEIDLFAISNLDEDHVSDLQNLRQSNVALRSLLRNKTVSEENLRSMKAEGGMGPGIEATVGMLREYTGGPRQTNWGSLSYTVFRNRYQTDFSDTNNLSLVLFLHCGGLHMVFAGDLERAGWLKLLEQENFQKELAAVNVFVASHHGRESGCCDEVFSQAGCSPDVFLMSDKATQFDTQKTIPWYRQRASGVVLSGQERRVLTTRSDGKITLQASATGYTVAIG